MGDLIELKEEIKITRSFFIPAPTNLQFYLILIIPSPRSYKQFFDIEYTCIYTKKDQIEASIFII